MGGVVAGLGLWKDPAWAQGAPARQAAGSLSGTDFDLSIGEALVDFTGSSKIAHTVNGSLPAPILRWREGDTVTLRVSNRLRDDQASIHWHGILLPANMDGVPGLSFNGIGPGETYVYRFQVRQGGTYWYHSHSAFQEQLGLYGALVIEPLEPEPFRYDREHVVLLSDWTDEDPERVFAKLKKQADYYNFGKRTVRTFFADAERSGLADTIKERWHESESRMDPSGLEAPSGETYTYLMNGQPPGANWTALFRPGERIRLRIINASAATYYDVRIPGLAMSVVNVHGNDVVPVQVDPDLSNNTWRADLG